MDWSGGWLFGDLLTGLEEQVARVQCRLLGLVARIKTEGVGACWLVVKLRELVDRV